MPEQQDIPIFVPVFFPPSWAVEWGQYDTGVLFASHNSHKGRFEWDIKERVWRNSEKRHIVISEEKKEKKNVK